MFLICVNGFILRQDAADGEETGLHDGVDASAHAGFCSDIIRIDDIEIEILFDDNLSELPWAGDPRLLLDRRCCSAGIPHLVWRI